MHEDNVCLPNKKKNTQDYRTSLFGTHRLCLQLPHSMLSTINQLVQVYKEVQEVVVVSLIVL